VPIHKKEVKGMEDLRKVPTMGRETIMALIDAFEDFLEENGVKELPNGNKPEGEDNSAIIYGDTFDALERTIRDVLERSGVVVADSFDGSRPVADTEDITIYIPSKGEILFIKEGTGGNLSPEDRENGYVDYIDFDVYVSTEPGGAIDGGQLMSKEYIREDYDSMADAIPEVLDFRYGTDDLTYVVLGGGRLFLMTPKKLAAAWNKVVEIFNPLDAYDKKITPDDTARSIINSLGIVAALEVFSAVVRFKEHDGRISPRNRVWLSEIPFDERCLIMDRRNPFFNCKLDAIHTSYINQMADALIKYAESVKG